MIRSLLLIMTAFMLSCQASQHSPNKAVKDFFAQLDDSSFVKDNFLLIDSMPGASWKNVFTSYAASDSSLSVDDIDYIASQVNNVKDDIWTNDIFDSASIISQKYIDSLSRKCPTGKKPHYYTFSLPYFSKSGQCCVLLYNYYVGKLCVETSLRLYRK